MKACLIALMVSAAFLIASMASSQQKGPISGKAAGASIYAELDTAPEKARAKPNPLSQDSGAISAGRILFERYCAECHGENAEGRKGPSLRAEEVQSAPPGALFWVLTNGVVRRGMPVWSRLPEPQRWQLVSYLKSLGMKPLEADARRATNSSN